MATRQSPGKYNALTCALDALKARAPDVLEQLRDADDVATWATRYHLNSPLVVEHLSKQRQWWHKYPAYAASLTFGGVTYLTGTMPDEAVDAWVQQHTHARYLPNPMRESLTAWRSRSDALYRSRAEIHQRRLPPQWTVFARQCDWFVQVQVLGKRPGTVSGADRAAIERATHKIAALLGLQRRTWPPGHPAKNCDSLVAP